MTKNKNQKSKQDKPKKSNKKKYKVRNWHEYNKALVDRGRLIVWVEESVLEDWYAKPTGKRGAQIVYSNKSIELTLQFGQVFSQRLRQTEGLVWSLFKLMGVNLEVPSYSTLSRRAEILPVKLPKERKGELTLIADSSGLKVYGEGEWKVRRYGYSKHRTWRKIHIAITPNGEFQAIDLKENSYTDGEVFPDLLSQVEGSIKKVAADGGYDKRKVYAACQERKVKTIAIPPQRNAKIFSHGNCNQPPHPRDENLRFIRKTTRKRWKEWIGYHVRSIGENAFFRFKTIFGDKLSARKLANQLTEVRIKTGILNKMRLLGMPQSYIAS